MTILRDQPVKQEKPEKLGRREITTILTRAVTKYMAKKNLSCHCEIGIIPGGTRRIDVLALNMKAHFIGIEVKSCIADYRADKKWRDYLPFTNKFYFIFPQSIYDNKKQYAKILEDIGDTGVGVMILDERYGRVRVVRNAKKRKVSKENKTRAIIKMAWRGGIGRHNMPDRFKSDRIV
jgi:hypothetical protein